MLREPQSPAQDPQALALGALGWVLSDGVRAERLLALTGLAPGDLRSRLGDPAVLGAVLDFLGGHEPDLIAVSDHLGVSPGALMAARMEL